MSAKLYHICGIQYEDTIKLLTRMRIIVSEKFKNGFVVARYGVNKGAIKAYIKKVGGK